MRKPIEFLTSIFDISRLSLFFIIYIIFYSSATQGLEAIRIGNALSHGPAGALEADTLRAAEGYARHGFDKNAGLPVINHGNKFPSKGCLNEHQHDDNSPHVYINNTSGSYRLTGLLAKFAGHERIMYMRFFPIVIFSISFLCFAAAHIRTNNPVQAFLLILLCILTPVFSNAAYGLHHYGYSFNLLLIELGCLAIYFKNFNQISKKWFLIFFAIGFLSGWMSFDYFFLAILAPVPFAVFSNTGKTKSLLGNCGFSTATLLIGFLSAGILYFFRLIDYHGNFSLAFESLFGIFFNAENMFAIKSKAQFFSHYIFDYVTRGEYFGSIFYLIIFLIGYLMITNERKNFYMLLALIFSFIISSLWILTANIQLSYEPSNQARHFFLFYYFCAISAIQLGEYHVKRHKIDTKIKEILANAPAHLHLFSGKICIIVKKYALFTICAFALALYSYKHILTPDNSLLSLFYGIESMISFHGVSVKSNYADIFFNLIYVYGKIIHLIVMIFSVILFNKLTLKMFPGPAVYSVTALYAASPFMLYMANHFHYALLNLFSLEISYSLHRLCSREKGRHLLRIVLASIFGAMVLRGAAIAIAMGWVTVFIFYIFKDSRKNIFASISERFNINTSAKSVTLFQYYSGILIALMFFSAFSRQQMMIKAAQIILSHMVFLLIVNWIFTSFRVLSDKSMKNIRTGLQAAAGILIIGAIIAGATLHLQQRTLFVFEEMIDMHKLKMKAVIYTFSRFDTLKIKLGGEWKGNLMNRSARTMNDENLNDISKLLADGKHVIFYGDLLNIATKHKKMLQSLSQMGYDKEIISFRNSSAAIYSPKSEEK